MWHVICILALPHPSRFAGSSCSLRRHAAANRELLSERASDAELCEHNRYSTWPTGGATSALAAAVHCQKRSCSFEVLCCVRVCAAVG